MDETNICPCCGQPKPDHEPKCEVQGCQNIGIWEGWYRCKDPLIGTPTGLLQRRQVCDEHKYLLEGEK